MNMSLGHGLGRTISVPPSLVHINPSEEVNSTPMFLIPRAFECNHSFAGGFNYSILPKIFFWCSIIYKGSVLWRFFEVCWSLSSRLKGILGIFTPKQQEVSDRASFSRYCWRGWWCSTWKGTKWSLGCNRSS